MTKILDPDFLSRNTEITFDFTQAQNRLIGLAIAGNMSSDGVTAQAVYSKCKELWKSEVDLIKIPFPFDPITPAQFDLINSWNWKDDQTRGLIRDAGWAVRDSSLVATEEWVGIVTLGAVGANDQLYYQQENNGAAQNFLRTGSVNQAIQTFKSGTGAFDRRNFLKLFSREQGKTYAQATLSDIGVSDLTYKDYAFPLTNSQDLKIGVNDAAIAASTPYTGMSITFFASVQTRVIGVSSFNFNVIINGNGAAIANIYEFVQYKLRQNTDIDEGLGVTVGKTADNLLRFLGDTLITSQGVFIDNFSATDTNHIDFYDDTNTVRRFPFVAAGSIVFNENLKSDVAAVYRLFFLAGFGTNSAIAVNDADGVPIGGNVNGRSNVSFTFDYDGNIQGGRTPGTDAQVVAVAIGLTKAQYVLSYFAIGRGTVNIANLVSSLERNFSNPV